MKRDEALKEAILKAKFVISEYKQHIRNPLTYNCESFIVNIIISEQIQIDSYSFKHEEICGMLCIDDYEKTIVYNSKHPRQRRNFTLAHELGHYFLHSKIQEKFADRSKNLEDNVMSIFEMQANAFASQILIPKKVLIHMLNNKYSFHKISKVTKVSYEALFWIIVNHLTNDFNMTRRDAILIVEDYRDYSIGSYKNLVHHGFAMIFKINIHNYEKIIENYRDGIKLFDFERNLNGDIIGVKASSQDPFSNNF